MASKGESRFVELTKGRKKVLSLRGQERKEKPGLNLLRLEAKHATSALNNNAVLHCLPLLLVIRA
jgi:hypothetical protein